LVASFDTYQAPGHVGKAASQIEDELKKKISGAEVLTPGLSALVLGREGPLQDGELPRAREFGKDFAQRLSE